MHEVYRTVLALLYDIWRKRWYALAAAYVVCLLGWVAVASIPDRFGSSARIYVDTETMLRPLMRGIAVDVNIMQQIDIMRRTLISRPNMEKVVRRSDMDLYAETPEQLELMIQDLESDIAITNQGLNLFKIGYESGNPDLTDDENRQMAKRVVQNLLTIFVESNLGANRQDLASARRFIDEQIADYERQLDEAERRQAEFQRRHADILAGDTTYIRRIESARNQMAATEAELSEATRIRDSLRVQLENEPAFVTIAGQVGPVLGGPGGPTTFGAGPSLSDLPARIAELERQIDALALRGYTDQHPDVIYAKRQLESLNTEYQQEQQAFVDQLEGEQSGEEQPVGASTTRMLNPLHEQIKVRLVEMETRIVGLTGRLEDQVTALKGLQDKAQQVPTVETQQAKLQRDYEILKGHYEELLARRESARMAQDLETKSDNVQFQIIDPPTEPITPSSPNRPLLLSGVLAAGLGVGVVLAFLLSQLQPVYLTVDRLREAFDLPVLGAVSAIASEQEGRQRRIEVSVFAVLLAGLPGAFAALLFVEILQGPLV